MSEEFVEEFLKVDEVLDPGKTKRCVHCRKIKSLERFYNSAKAKDGKQVWCIDCTKEHNKRRQSGLPKKRGPKNGKRNLIRVEKIWRETPSDDIEQIGSIQVYHTFVKVILKVKPYGVEVEAKVKGKHRG